MVGRQIRRRRRYLEIKQTEVAEALGVRPATVSDWEHGRGSLTVEKLAQIAVLLETTAADLLREDGENRHDRTVAA